MNLILKVEKNDYIVLVFFLLIYKTIVQIKLNLIFNFHDLFLFIIKPFFYKHFILELDE